MIVCHRDTLLARCHQRGYTLEETMPCVVSTDGDRWSVDESHASYPRHKCRAGSELKRLLKSLLGESPGQGCQCDRRAALMDARGCDWCEAHVDAIASWLGSEASKRRVPYHPSVGKMLVRLAIRRARKRGIS